MKQGAFLGAIAVGLLAASSALGDAGLDGGSDAATDGAAGAAGAAGAGGAAGSAGSDGGGGSGGTVTCGTNTCTGWNVAGLLAVDACCAGPNLDQCGALVDSTISGLANIPEGCHEIDQPGNLECDCPSMSFPNPLGGGNIDLPGCCRTESSTCGNVADLSFVQGPNMGCIDGTLFQGDGAAPIACTPGADDPPCATDAGTGGSGGSGGSGGGGGTGGATTGGTGGGVTGGSAGSATDAGTSGGDSEDDGGCGCRTPASTGSGAAWLGALVLLGVLGLRRRRAR